MTNESRFHDPKVTDISPEVRKKFSDKASSPEAMYFVRKAMQPLPHRRSMLSKRIKMDKDYVDAKIEAAESRIGKDIAQMENRLESVIRTELRDNVPSIGKIALVAAGTVLSLAGVIFALLASNADRYDSGFSHSAAYSERLDAIEDKLDALAKPRASDK